MREVISPLGPCEGRFQTVAPPRDDSTPRFEPRSERAHKAPRPSSPTLCRPNAKGYLMPDFCSGAARKSGRFSEGLLLRSLQPFA